jgi:hypothetical protein
MMTPERYATLCAIRDGKPHARWAMMRRAMLRLKWITPGPDHEVTRAGHLAIAEFEAERRARPLPAAPHNPVVVKPTYGKGGPCGP